MGWFTNRVRAMGGEIAQLRQERDSFFRLAEQYQWECNKLRIENERLRYALNDIFWACANSYEHDALVGKIRLYTEPTPQEAAPQQEQGQG